MFTPPVLGQHCTLSDKLWRMEEKLWTSGLDSARAVCPVGAATILPDPESTLQGHEYGLYRPANTGWHKVAMDDRAINQRGPVAILAYRIHAQKANTPVYHALCASTWLNDAGIWQRLSHHHTPL